jgi:hypothetical protein
LAERKGEGVYIHVYTFRIKRNEMKKFHTNPLL